MSASNLYRMVVITHQREGYWTAIVQVVTEGAALVEAEGDGIEEADAVAVAARAALSEARRRAA